MIFIAITVTITAMIVITIIIIAIVTLVIIITIVIVVVKAWGRVLESTGCSAGNEETYDEQLQYAIRVSRE